MTICLEQMHVVRNSTACIAGVCKHLRKQGRMDDQETVYILAQLKAIERVLEPVQPVFTDVRWIA